MPSLFLKCAHAGCLMELCIQLCITMLGKQLIQNNLFEIGIPWVHYQWHTVQHYCGCCCYMSVIDILKVQICFINQWLLVFAGSWKKCFDEGSQSWTQSKRRSWTKPSSAMRKTTFSVLLLALIQSIWKWVSLNSCLVLIYSCWDTRQQLIDKQYI